MLGHNTYNTLCSCCAEALDVELAGARLEQVTAGLLMAALVPEHVLWIGKYKHAQHDMQASAIRQTGIAQCCRPCCHGMHTVHVHFACTPMRKLFYTE